MESISGQGLNSGRMSGQTSEAKEREPLSVVAYRARDLPHPDSGFCVLEVKGRGRAISLTVFGGAPAWGGLLRLNEANLLVGMSGPFLTLVGLLPYELKQ
jgi:hypothetical protein